MMCYYDMYMLGNKNMHSQLDAMKSHICCGGAEKLQQHINGHPVELYEKLLVYAAECGELGCVQILVNHCDPDNTTALAQAAYYGQKSCVDFLLPSKHAGNALINIIAQQYNGCLQTIVPHCESEVCAVGLRHAIERNYLFGADFLIDYCDCTTVLQDFYNCGNTDCAQRLEQAVARKQKSLLVQHTKDAQRVVRLHKI